MPVKNAGVLFTGHLMKLMHDGWNEYPNVLLNIFNHNKSTKRFEEWTGMVGIGKAEEKPFGQPMVYKDLSVETPKRIQMRTFAVGLRLVMEDIQDDQTGVLERTAPMFGRAHGVSIELDCASVFNTAFSTTLFTGYDGKALCATDHPLEKPTWDPATDFDWSTGPNKYTWANRLPADADLDYTSYLDMLTLLRRQVARDGIPLELTPQFILVPPELEPIAFEVTKSEMRPDTANNAKSWGYSKVRQIVVSNFLFDTDMWFILADQHDLQYFERMPFKTRKRDAEGTWDTIIESVHRHGVGFHDPRGIVGSAGA